MVKYNCSAGFCGCENGSFSLLLDTVAKVIYHCCASGWQGARISAGKRCCQVSVIPVRAGWKD